MSRIAKTPIIIPVNVKIEINYPNIFIQGDKEKLSYHINKAVNVNYINNKLICIPHKNYKHNWVLAGTTRSILNSMIIGVTKGFSKTLHLIGVGYRAILTNKTIKLFLGFSHPITHHLPDDIIAECPTPTEIILKGANKCLVGQVAADLRNYKIPEPYKGKGIRYANEIMRNKIAKKK